MKYLTIVLGLCCTSFAYGLTVDLRAEDIEALDGQDTLVLDFTGLQVNISATGGVTNRTRNGFGVNAPGGADDADAIDGDAGAEAITVAFSEQVRLLAIALSGFGRADRAELQLDDRILPVTSGGVLGSVADVPLTTGLTLRHVTGNGFSLDRIDFERRPPADATQGTTDPVPASAPGTLGLSLLGLTALYGARHRHRPTRPGVARRRQNEHNSGLPDSSV